MAPGSQVDEAAALTRRLAELEAQVDQLQRNSTDQFRRLSDDAPVMIWTTGQDAQCDYVNRAWLEFRGRAQQDELGRGWTDGLHPDDRNLCLETFFRSFTARQPFRMQCRVQRSDGVYAWVEGHGMPRQHSDGTFAGFMVACADITERKRGIFTPDEEATRMVFALTERERQVLVLIAEGKSTKEAAAKLGISYKTADSHRSRIL